MDPHDEPSESEPAPKIPGIWKRWGGGALSIALILHLIALVIGACWVFQLIREPEKKIDFIPGGSGGGGGERGAKTQIQQRKQAQLKPAANVKRVFAEGAVSQFAIPDPGDQFGEMSTLSSLAAGGAGGLGGSGSGGGFGSGRGKGVGAGIGDGMGGAGLGIKLFGMNLDVKSIGVVFDVSRSMTPHLQRVLEEIDRVAADSPVILHVGCGIGPVKGRDRDRIVPVSAPRDAFKKFWYLNQDPENRGIPAGSDASDVDTSGAIPQRAVYELLANRSKTYFHDRGTTPATGAALLADELAHVEAIYWFADFQDFIDEKQAERIAKTLIRRKQKLYIHPLTKGRCFDVALQTLALPTGGKPIEEKKAKKGGKQEN